MHKTLTIVGTLVLVGLVGHSITKNVIESRNEAKTLIAINVPWNGGSASGSGASGGSSGTSGISGGNSGTSGVSGGSSGNSGSSGGSVTTKMDDCDDCQEQIVALNDADLALFQARAVLESIKGSPRGTLEWVQALAAASQNVGIAEHEYEKAEKAYKICVEAAHISYRAGKCLINGKTYNQQLEEDNAKRKRDLKTLKAKTQIKK